MAKSSIATGATLAKKLYIAQLVEDRSKDRYFNKFEGTGNDSMIKVNRDLEKGKGESIVIGMVPRLSGNGVTEGTELEGREEAITTYNQTVTLSQYRHAVRDDGAMTRQRTAFDFDMESQDALMNWYVEKDDQLTFDALNSPVPTRVFYSVAGVNTSNATAATAKAALTAADVITPNLLSYAKAWITTGGNRSQTPLKPLKVNGKDYFICLVHPDVLHDMQENAAFQQAAREALARGTENPIFSGSSHIYNGFVIHAHENVPIAKDGGGATVPWSSCMILGRQALLKAIGKPLKIVTKYHDYENEYGHAVSFIQKVDKAKFNSLDYGMVGLYVARTAISDV